MAVLAEYHFGDEFSNCRCQIIGDMEELIANKKERDKSLARVAEMLQEEMLREKDDSAV